MLRHDAWSLTAPKQLESALDTCDMNYLSPLCILLLRALSSHPASIDKTNWEQMLMKQYALRGYERTSLGTAEEPVPWVSLSIEDKISTIHDLCEWQLEQPDRLRRNISEEDARSWRVDAAGWDRVGNTYWLFDDNRLWIQRVPQPRKRKAPAKKPPAKPQKATRANGATRRSARASSGGGPPKRPEDYFDSDSELSPPEDEEPVWNEFETICVTRREWESFVAQFAQSKHPDERSLHKYIANEVLPRVVEVITEEERREAMELALTNRKRSSRIALKESEKEERDRAEAVLLEHEARVRAQAARERDLAAREAAEQAAQNSREARLREREERILSRERSLLERSQRDEEERVRREQERDERVRKREGAADSEGTASVPASGVPSPSPDAGALRFNAPADALASSHGTVPLSMDGTSARAQTGATHALPSQADRSASGHWPTGVLQRAVGHDTAEASDAQPAPGIAPSAPWPPHRHGVAPLLSGQASTMPNMVKEWGVMHDVASLSPETSLSNDIGSPVPTTQRKGPARSASSSISMPVYLLEVPTCPTGDSALSLAPSAGVLDHNTQPVSEPTVTHVSLPVHAAPHEPRGPFHPTQPLAHPPNAPAPSSDGPQVAPAAPHAAADAQHGPNAWSPPRFGRNVPNTSGSYPMRTNVARSPLSRPNDRDERAASQDLPPHSAL